MTPQQAAMTLNCSVKTIYRLVTRGELGGYRVGNRIRLSEESVRAYTERHAIRRSGHAAANYLMVHF